MEDKIIGFRNHKQPQILITKNGNHVWENLSDTKDFDGAISILQSLRDVVTSKLPQMQNLGVGIRKNIKFNYGESVNSEIDLQKVGESFNIKHVNPIFVPESKQNDDDEFLLESDAGSDENASAFQKTEFNRKQKSTRRIEMDQKNLGSSPIQNTEMSVRNRESISLNSPSPLTTGVPAEMTHSSDHQSVQRERGMVSPSKLFSVSSEPPVDSHIIPPEFYPTNLNPLKDVTGTDQHRSGITNAGNLVDLSCGRVHSQSKREAGIDYGISANQQPEPDENIIESLENMKVGHLDFRSPQKHALNSDNAPENTQLQSRYGAGRAKCDPNRINKVMGSHPDLYTDDAPDGLWENGESTRKVNIHIGNSDRKTGCLNGQIGVKTTPNHLYSSELASGGQKSQLGTYKTDFDTVCDSKSGLLKPDSNTRDTGSQPNNENQKDLSALLRNIVDQNMKFRSPPPRPLYTSITENQNTKNTLTNQFQTETDRQNNKFKEELSSPCDGLSYHRKYDTTSFQNDFDGLNLVDSNLRDVDAADLLHKDHSKGKETVVISKDSKTRGTRNLVLKKLTGSTPQKNSDSKGYNLYRKPIFYAKSPRRALTFHHDILSRAKKAHFTSMNIKKTRPSIIPLQKYTVTQHNLKVQKITGTRKKPENLETRQVALDSKLLSGPPPTMPLTAHLIDVTRLQKPDSPSRHSDSSTLQSNIETHKSIALAPQGTDTFVPEETSHENIDLKYLEKQADPLVELHKQQTEPIPVPSHNRKRSVKDAKVKNKAKEKAKEKNDDIFQDLPEDIMDEFFISQHDIEKYEHMFNKK